MKNNRALPLNRKPRFLLLDGQTRYDYSYWFFADRPVFNPFEKAHIPVKSRQEFVDALESEGKKGLIDFMLVNAQHGSNYHLLFPDDSVITADDINSGALAGLNQYFANSYPNSSFINACCVADLREGSFAEKFFKALEINGEAPITTVRTAPIFDSRLRVSPDYPRRYAESFEEEVAFRYFKNH